MLEYWQHFHYPQAASSVNIVIPVISGGFVAWMVGFSSDVGTKTVSAIETKRGDSRSRMTQN